MKMYLDNNFKLSPTSFTNFIWWLYHNAILICVTFMQFKVNLFNISGHVFIIVGLNIHGPLMRVTVFFPLFTEVSGYVSINNWFNNTDTLKFKHSVYESGTQLKCSHLCYLHSTPRIWAKIRG